MDNQLLLQFIRENYDKTYEEIASDFNKLYNESYNAEQIRYICKKNRSIFPPKKVMTQNTKKEGLKKVLLLADVHLEADIPVSNAYKLMKQFAQYIKPDLVVIMGDFINFDTISKFNIDKPRIVENKRLAKDIALANEELDFWCNLADEVVYIEGNHEFRLQHYLDKNPSLEGLLDLPLMLKFNERKNLTFVEINLEYQIYNTKLYVVHGAYHNIYHTKKHLDTYNLPHLVYGHLHHKQVHTKTTRTTNYTCESLGCLCDLNPMYLRNKPSKFQNGFGFAYVDWSTQQHTFYNIIIDDNQFIFEGKIFKYMEE